MSSLSPELYERMRELLEALNLRGEHCPCCLMKRGLYGYHKHGCELQAVLRELRKAGKIPA